MENKNIKRIDETLKEVVELQQDIVDLRNKSYICKNNTTNH